MKKISKRLVSLFFTSDDSVISVHELHNKEAVARKTIRVRIFFLANWAQDKYRQVFTSYRLNCENSWISDLTCVTLLCAIVHHQGHIGHGLFQSELHRL